MSQSQLKATRKVHLLDEARCNGQWELVPELVRKIRKHAPGRTCLTLTAEVEHAVNLAISSRPRGDHRATAKLENANAPPDIARFIPCLLEAIENEKRYVEDEFQAQICLGWVHWHLGEPALAAGRLPKKIEQEYSQLDGTNKESSGWTQVTAIRGAHIKALSQEKLGLIAEALGTYASALPIISSGAVRQGTSELRSWTELFLTEFCLMSSRAISARIVSLSEPGVLLPFRAWAEYWELRSSAAIGGSLPHASAPRREVWQVYYLTLSDYQQQGLPFPGPLSSVNHADFATRSQQRAELKNVETRYFNILLNEVGFPQANDSSDEVESFVDIVIQNWRIMYGGTGHGLDLGESGAEALSRNVLDILYQAATVTFHSTSILRHLFTVHLAVAEFDVAFKVFDTYLEIIKKGRARIEKTGKPEHSLDDEETVLKAGSVCIQALCRYGSRLGAEKAKELCEYFEEWLNTYNVTLSIRKGQAVEITPAVSVISPKTIAVAWRCIGDAHAHWARMSFDASSREENQARAIHCFRNALLPKNESMNDVETLSGFSLVLAEQRKLAAAIDAVKSGLLEPSTSSVSGPHTPRFARQRSLIPMWHLLALLMSARQDFVMAARFCEGAFEQFQAPQNLFGENELNSTQSEHLKLNEKPASVKPGVVDEMDDLEKESVLEIKMTQLALVEVLEGPELAVDAGGELLSLYARLFGEDSAHRASIALPVKALTAPPRTSASTIKSIKGSIFGRSSRSVRKPSAIADAVDGEKPLISVTPEIRQSAPSLHAPVIQVTNGTGALSLKKHHSILKSDHTRIHEKLHKRPGSMRGKAPGRESTPSVSDVNGNARRLPYERIPTVAPVSVPASAVAPATVVDGEAFYTPVPDKGHWLGNGFQVNQTPSSKKACFHSVEEPPSPKHILSNPHSPGYKKPLKSIVPTAVPKNINLPCNRASGGAPDPVTRFPKEQQRRRRAVLLVKVWLHIAGLYRRADLYDDAKGALDEANRLVHGLEGDDLRDHDGNAAENNVGLAQMINVGRLYADVHAERGYLSLVSSSPLVALSDFEAALERYANHSGAIIGLSNVLLDIYNGDITTPPAIPSLIPTNRLASSISTLPTGLIGSMSTATPVSVPQRHNSNSAMSSSHATPLGLSSNNPSHLPSPTHRHLTETLQQSTKLEMHPDRLAARERAYSLLSSLTRLDDGWNNPEAWYALGKAHELAGQEDKAREALWWCVDCEEASGIRAWAVCIPGRGF